MSIHLPGRYFVFPPATAFIVVGFFFLFSWIFYKLTYRNLFSSFLIWVHIIFTLIASVVVITIPFWENASYKSVIIVDWSQFEQFRKVTRIAAVTLLAFMFGQASFLINFVGGLLKPPQHDLHSVRVR